MSPKAHALHAWGFCSLGLRRQFEQRPQLQFYLVRSADSTASSIVGASIVSCATAAGNAASGTTMRLPTWHHSSCGRRLRLACWRGDGRRGRSQPVVPLRWSRPVLCALWAAARATLRSSASVVRTDPAPRRSTLTGRSLFEAFVGSRGERVNFGGWPLERSGVMAVVHVC